MIFWSGTLAGILEVLLLLTVLLRLWRGLLDQPDAAPTDASQRFAAPRPVPAAE
jgi:hypothetical protein